MSLFTYIKYPVSPASWDGQTWFNILPKEIIKHWAHHKDIRNIKTHPCIYDEELKKHNINLLKKIILEWEDDDI